MYGHSTRPHENIDLIRAYVREPNLSIRRRL